ncbi:LacI family DNA-binding transcriptional regulator [Roseovarius pelagicus]|uniref:LacI family transcriptional regulator n=1 Tax=Roseovarius pelagicus TaxID=2980108 RepID=A0ABY6DAH8_9RHOB|nr:LacI family DNA-binding transcriptional regulator [Roseovarius pelagicus]UXX83159.1 LacI family transcriptional regulator [Roseovarius pelagicus]
MKERTTGSPRRVTIKDIAQTLGISHATVSRALRDSPQISGSTKDRIREAAAEMGYAPDTAARVMRGEDSNLVGFILPDVQNHFYSAMAKALAETVSAQGLQLVLAISEDDPEEEHRQVLELSRARARGIVITPVENLMPETSVLLANMRAVQLVRSHPDVNADLVAAQDADATYLSTRHLLSLGHRHVAYLGGGAETLSTGTSRLEGYLRAIAETENARSLSRLIPPRPANAYVAAKELLGTADPPTALVIGSSQIALGVLQVIQEFGLSAPEDISLVSYDDPDWHRLWGRGLTTIELPIREMAKFAAQMICTSDSTIPQHITVQREQLATGNKYLFPVELLERGSCGPPRQS